MNFMVETNILRFFINKLMITIQKEIIEAIVI